MAPVSVRGEFVRLVGDAAEALRADPDAGDPLADALLQARAGAAEDLPAAAARVLELWEGASSERLALRDETRVRLDASCERMLAVARIILGR